MRIGGAGVLDLLKSPGWGLPIAREQAQRLLAQRDRRRTARQLLTALITNNPEQRVRAADVARRITERDADFLAPHATELASILADTPIAESRTRWHLGLVVARSARTPRQIHLAAEILWQPSEDKSNVVRCFAVEGLACWRAATARCATPSNPTCTRRSSPAHPPCASVPATHFAGCNPARARPAVLTECPDSVIPAHRRTTSGPPHTAIARKSFKSALNRRASFGKRRALISFIPKEKAAAR